MDPFFKTGKAGNILINAAVVAITKWSSKVIKEYADSTDSNGFDPISRQLWKTQAAGSLQLEGSIEGYFNFNVGLSAILAAVLDDIPILTVLKFDETLTYTTGLMNFLDFDSDVEVDGAVTIPYTTNFKSYGPCVMA